LKGMLHKVLLTQIARRNCRNVDKSKLTFWRQLL